MTKLLAISYRYLLKPILFRLDPEFVHDTFTKFGKILGKFRLTKALTRTLFAYKNPKLSQTIRGIKFPNPVGLSAGFDKDGDLINIIEDVGFGFTQVGSVTNLPYKGNPKPRLYRLPKSKGIVVYYGLKNQGIDKIAPKIKPQKIPVSISIAKTNDASTATNQSGIEDYYQCLKKSQNLGDFYTINISCPNTCGGEPFTTPKKLDQLLTKLQTLKITKPIFLKMPSNLAWPEFKKLLDVAVKHKIQGVVIANLNKDHKHPTIKDKIPAHIKGSISGLPVQEISTKLIAQTYKHYGSKLIIIGVGGIFSAQDAYDKIKAGASLVQLITGMIYQGPQLIGQINQELVQLLQKDGHKNISDAIGTSID